MAFRTSSKRAQKRYVKAAGKLLQPGTEVRGAGFGRGHLRWTTTATVCAGIFAVIFIIGLIQGQLVFPGGILLLVTVLEIRPFRIVVVAKQGVAIFSMNFLRQMPNKVLSLQPLSSMHPQSAKNGSFGTKIVQFGDETVTFTAKEYERLSELAGTVYHENAGEQPAA